MTNSTMNSIVKDWSKSFPCLHKYGSKQLLKIVGPIAMGINLDTIFQNTYRPEFVIINLLDDKYPKPIHVIYQLLRGKNRVEVTIPYNKHEVMLTHAIQFMQEQPVIQILSTPGPEDVIKGIIRFLDEDYMKGVNRFHQFKAIAMLSRLLKDSNKAEEYFIFAQKSFKLLPPSALEACTGGYDKWIDSVKNIEPSKLLNNVQMNIDRWKIPVN